MLDDGIIFEAAAQRALQAWHGQHPGRQAELAGARAALKERRAAIDRSSARRARPRDQGTGGPDRELEAACETTPEMVTRYDLANVRRGIERAVADGAPQQLKRLLDSVVDQILVESRACIQPYFMAPMVRTRIDQRRRTGKHANHGAPGPSLWVTTRAWGRVD